MVRALLALAACCCHALLPAQRVGRPKRVILRAGDDDDRSFPVMPGQSRGRISEEVARARTSWPHWDAKERQKQKEKDEAIPAKVERPKLPGGGAPPAAAARPAAAKAYTLRSYQSLVETRARHDALLALVGATGRLAEAARRPDAAVDDELAGVLRAVAEYASERGLGLDDLAARSMERP